ncbi:Protocadherin Fat 2 [Taenia solium]|eukprot:TsM_000660200 transcript=TsM_000660200 gene=TsM_000660200
MRIQRLYVWCYILLCHAQQRDSNLDFLTPNRDEIINFFFPHFTPYCDMMDLVLRASKFGFPSYLRRTLVLPDCFVFNIPSNMLFSPTTPIEFHIATYVKNLIQLAKVKTERISSQDSLIESTKHVWLNSFRPANFQNFIQAHALRLLIYDEMAMMNAEKTARVGTINVPLVNSYAYPSNSTQNIPISILTMSGWRLLFWTAVSQMPNFYHTLYRHKSEGHVTSIRAPSRLDELSSTFLFHLCAEMRQDRTLLETDIPTGFCPNPCATSPCQTLPHTTGQCYLTGRGLFMNDFGCECLPGFKWVAAITGGKEETEENEVGTPLSDEIGICVAIDICESYCNPLGTRQCDVIPGTGTAICLCKLTSMGPTCSAQRDPCVELSDKEKMPGNMACNTGQGGLCIPTLGSDLYECRCAPSWTKDVGFDFDNCLALKDKCASEVCVRGDCISSADGSNVICLCPEEAYGERCENLRGNWGQWSPWSACSPACGHGKIRYRERVRGCLYGATCRGGRRRQVEVCTENLPCPDEMVMLGLGPEALAPRDVFQGGEAQPNFDLQLACALKRRWYSLLTQVLKFVFFLLCAFAIVSATTMFAYAVLY